MLNWAWQNLTLSTIPLYRWQAGSFAYKAVGLFRPWRQGSWLLQWAEPIGALIISLIFLLSPFVSTSLIGVLLIAAGGYWLLLTLADDLRDEVTPIHLLVLLYWGIATIATAFSPVKEAAFSGWVKLTLYLLLFALTAKVLRSRTLRSYIIGVYLHTALIVSVYGIRQEFFGAEQLATWNDPNSALADNTRVYSYLGNPNLLAAYLLSAIALSVAAFFVWRRLLPKALAVLMIVVNTFCLYFTDSRGGWLALLALIFAFLLLLRVWWHDYLPRFWQVWLLPIVFGILVGLGVVAFVEVEPLRLRVLSMVAGREDSSNNFRLNVWAGVMDMIRDRALIGIGPGNEAFNQIYPLYQRPKYTALSAYSVYLELMVETGMVGFAAFMWLIFVTLTQGVKQLVRLRQIKDREGFWLIAAMSAIAGFLVNGLFDTVWYRPQISTLWWLMVAIIASFYANATQTRDVAPQQELS
jgi:putative inorganic carbon (HCO3(-)) transporter